MEKKEFFINAINMIDIEGNANIPTVLYYQDKGPPLIGSAALAAAESRLDINEDFKIDIGFIEPTSTALRKTFVTASGNYKSAAGLTADFLHQLMRHARNWLASNGIDTKPSIMLAEPLAMQAELASSDWLSRYRRNLERILAGKGFEKISFLPEPFAVFQYYRHGLRHPVVSARAKQNALVIDFGGGSFDVCIIETTKEGDISQSGRNSRPLAASSTPIGGFYINRMIAEYLIKKIASNAKYVRRQIRKGLEAYKNWRKNIIEPSMLSEELANFVRNFHSLIYNIENTKLAICRNITDWELDASISLNGPIVLPKNIFSDYTKTISIMLSAAELRDIFIEKVWNPHLKIIIQQALQRGKEELSGAPISVVLLSGGSANIGWLRHLLEDEFADQIGHAEILRLQDFQEVVAKGLAVECARRFYNEKGDFSSVTYNRLCLILDPDKTGYELKPFKVRSKGLPDVRKKPGVLLPSASVLQNFIEKSMCWRVRLDRPPHQQLDYFFLRSSFDPDDLESLQNIIDHRVYTPRNCSFDSAIQLELLVKSDGTAYPTFIYKTGRTEQERIQVKAKPFYLDMTCSRVETTARAYIGLDFGTSNTSVSYVDQFCIETYRRRTAEKSWMDLSDLANILPYPLANPLSQYLSQSEPTRLVQKAREFIEAALTLGAYISYLEYCVVKERRKSKIFAGFRQRSAGPVWDLLKTCVKKLGRNEGVSSPYKELMSDEFRTLLDDTVTFFAYVKHEKARESSFDTLRPVRILANVSAKVFDRNKFGYFETVQKKRFSKEYQGLFRQAHGQHPPFIRTWKYHGDISFSEDDPVLFNEQEGTVLSLQPLIFWDHCIQHPDLDNGHCYFFDKEDRKREIFTFKAVGYPCVCEVSITNEYSTLANILIKMTNQDQSRAFQKIGLMEEIQLA